MSRIGIAVPAVIVAVLLLMMTRTIHAQEDCAAQIQLAFSRAFGACADLDRNAVCYGSGDLIAAYQTQVDDATLDQIGDVAPLTSIDTLTLASPSVDAWSMAFLRVQANLESSSQRSVLGIVYGDATLTNLIDSVPQVRAAPLGTLTIRETPDTQAEIIARVNINGEVFVNGVDEDGEWLRVQVPNTDRLGWISAEIVDIEDDTVVLNTVTVDSRVPRPFEAFRLTTSSGQLCADAPASGLLLQSPNLEDTVQLNINGVDLTFTGTVLLAAVPDAPLTVATIEGTAIVVVGEDTLRLAAGAQAQIHADDDSAVVPYNLAAVALSPLLYVERRVQPPAPLTVDAITDLQAEPMHIEVPPEPVTMTCTYQVISDQNLRTGPSLESGVARGIEAGELVFPRGQSIAGDGLTWYQVGEQAWIRSSVLSVDGDCDPIPMLDVEFVTTTGVNTLSLEECDPLNGPLRVGQRVTLTFIPPPWENYPAALEATRTSRGRFLVGDAYLWPRVSSPVRISDNEFIRQFSAEWTAEAGTFRLEGGHFAYEVICTITILPN